MSDHQSAFCPLYRRGVELIGRRWTGVIVREMLNGATRFAELRATIPDLSDRMLSERLKELESEGVVTRTVFPETPVRIKYTLTEKGRALESVIDELSQWAEHWLVPESSSP